MTKAILTECTKGGSRAWTQGSPGWLIKFDYDLGVVERLKEAVIPQFREWRPDEQRWWISEKFEDELDNLFANFCLFRDQPALL